MDSCGVNGVTDLLSIDSQFVLHEDGYEKMFSVKFGRMFWVVTVTVTVGVLIFSSISFPTFTSPLYTILLEKLLCLFGCIIGTLSGILATKSMVVVLKSSFAGVSLYFAMKVTEIFFGRHSIKIMRVAKEGALIHVISIKRWAGKRFWAICINVPMSVSEGFSVGIRSYSIEF